MCVLLHRATLSHAFEDLSHSCAMTFRGNGQNIIYIDWDNDLVVVVRWIDGGDTLNAFIGKVGGAIRPASTP